MTAFGGSRPQGGERPRGQVARQAYLPVPLIKGFSPNTLAVTIRKNRHIHSICGVEPRVCLRTPLPVAEAVPGEAAGRRSPFPLRGSETIANQQKRRR